MKSSRPEDLELLAQQLERSGDYRVLRKLKPLEMYDRKISEDHKVAVILDLETTGLDLRFDDVTELAMVRFAYRSGGGLIGPVDTFDCLREPNRPIPLDISNLTGISNEMVRGKQIASEAVGQFIQEAGVIIAHNASFDRPFAERLWPIFREKAWACSATQVRWQAHGFQSAGLEALLASRKLFYDGHRALIDCTALYTILGWTIGSPERLALAELLGNARATTYRIWAVDAPFAYKDDLKSRGYRWNDGSDGRRRAWCIEVEKSGLDAELSYLEAKIYQREIRLPVEKITPFERFSNRG